MMAVGRTGGRAVVWIAAWLAARPADRLSAQWPPHAMDRPRPPVVDPGPEQPPAPPPSDALVLFDGNSVSEWTGPGGGVRPRWVVRDGYVEVVGGAGNMTTRRRFGDIQLHVEWATPGSPSGEGQERGNSGVFLMGLYEIQVLDSYRNVTYADGQAAALYGQVPPLVNASRPPGQWQSYDVVFHRPRFAPDGSLVEPARVTLLHNGVLVHDHAALRGRTAHGRPARYEPHADRLPLVLQDHGSPVRYRTIWVRELER